MMQISANYSTALYELIQEGDAPVDAIEVGPWFGVSDISKFQKKLPGWQFYFHPGGMVSWIGVIPGAIDKFEAYQKQTQTPWLSVHLTLLRFGAYLMHRAFRLRLAAKDTDQAVRKLVRQVRDLKASVSVPVIMENMPCLPYDGNFAQIHPAEITRVLEETDCDLLLDIGHARIAARGLNLCVVEYLSQLPLEKVVQVHASGPREVKGRLHDSHEPLQQVDYELLDWVLDHTHPAVLTLEYFKEKQALREQLYQLRELADSRDLGL